MSRKLVLVMTLLIGMTVLTFNFQLGNGSSSGSNSYKSAIRIAGSGSDIVDGVWVVLEASPQKVNLGETVNVTITATNVDVVNKTLILNFESYVFDILVYNETFSWRWTEGRPFPIMPPRPIILQPGETYTENTEWNLYIYVNETYVPPQQGFYEMGIPDHDIICSVDITVIPEFPSFLILPLFMIATLLAVIVYKRKGKV